MACRSWFSICLDPVRSRSHKVKNGHVRSVHDLSFVKTDAPGSQGCEECIAVGDTWVDAMVKSRTAVRETG